LLAAKDGRGQNRFWTGADLALQVMSEDKPERDLVDKRGDYAEAGVPEYWIVNPISETITALRLRDSTYEEAGVYRRGQAAVSVCPDFSVEVAKIFDSARMK
jgi:Uma2 family endonuclease